MAFVHEPMATVPSIVGKQHVSTKPIYVMFVHCFCEDFVGIDLNICYNIEGCALDSMFSI